MAGFVRNVEIAYWSAIAISGLIFVGALLLMLRTARRFHAANATVQAGLVIVFGIVAFVSYELLVDFLARFLVRRVAFVESVDLGWLVLVGIPVACTLLVFVIEKARTRRASAARAN
jgi:hypothetical protein